MNSPSGREPHEPTTPSGRCQREHGHASRPQHRTSSFGYSSPASITRRATPGQELRGFDLEQPDERRLVLLLERNDVEDAEAPAGVEVDLLARLDPGIA
jgi:hypothetical protein